MSPKVSCKVSVIIPTYNRAEYICETLESVFTQTYPDFEVIIVDDGSTDHTKDVLKPYLNRVQYIYKNNGGPASARNTGIRASTGKYIAFLDSDDLWMPDKLQVQADFLEAHPEYAMVFSGYEFIGERKVKHLKKPRVFYDCTVDALLEGNKIATLTVMVRKEVFDVVGKFDEDPQIIALEDYSFWLRVAPKYKIAYVDRPLAKYRIHPSNISLDLSPLLEKERIVLKKWLKDQKRPDPQIRLAVEKRLNFIRFEQSYRSGSREMQMEARRAYIEILRKDPFYLKGYVMFACTYLPPHWIAAGRQYYLPVKRFFIP
jgi:glycosyltransferase involved in cell wall biosynthesis